MRWTVLAEYPPEDLKCDPIYEWCIHPQYCRIEWDGIEARVEDKERWTVGLMHRHWDTSEYAPANPGNPSPPDMFHCGIVNPEQADPNGFPEYQCDKCGKEAPKAVVEEKLDRVSSLKGVDPRNDRRGAVLATRDSNLKEGTVNV